MKTPLQRYEELVASKEFEANAMQKKVVIELEQIFLKLMNNWQPTNRFLNFILRRKTTPVKGLYLWGGVGIGKTWMMDIFYEALPAEGKMRQHFHQFMLQIHQQLKKFKDEKNPLEKIASAIAKNYKVICFDEFFVSDIADAMLLAGLFKALFAKGITLVTTSNVKPDNLYKGGISRDRFLPAIRLLKEYTQVMHISSEKDYRLRELKTGGTYLTPIGEATRRKMRRLFESLAGGDWQPNQLITVKGRGIQTLRVSRNIIWFLFEDLCTVPRSQVDYLEIAESYHTVLLSNVPKLAPKDTNKALYLIHLVDVFYDAKVKLIISAACEIDDLYQEGKLKFEFARTLSRLHEMQTLEYLQQPHEY